MKAKRSLELKKTELGNARIAKALKKMGIEDGGVSANMIELGFLHMRYKGKEISRRQRRFILNKLLTGNALPKYSLWILQFERYAELIYKMRKG